MTIPPSLLDDLASRATGLPRVLSSEQGQADCDVGEKWEDMTQAQFQWCLAMDGATNDKLGAGIRAFASDTDKLVEILKQHPDMDLVNY